MPLNNDEVTRIITTGLAEDLGKGDITSDLVITSNASMEFSITTREPLVTAGVSVAEQVFHTVDSSLTIQCTTQDGESVKAGTTLLSGHGNARSILAAERLALNLLQRMCGIATYTQEFVDLVAGTKAKILDTRKTTPGLRELEKYAVTCGGGHNHRFCLDDGILIKDNHIVICGSLTEAVNRAKAGKTADIIVEVECDTLEQVSEALTAQPDRIMLDNMTNEQLQKAVDMADGRIPLEASGNVSKETIAAIAKTGVDYISIGKLTHSVKSMDIGLDS